MRRLTRGRVGRLMVMSVAVALMAAACGGDGGRFEELTVAQARIGAPTGPNAALYFLARGTDEADTLIGASTEVAESIEIHETVTDDDGTMTMQPVSELELPAEGQLVLEPGGLHLMLVNVDDLEVGDTVTVTLTWENYGDMDIEAAVVDPADTMGDMGEEGDG